MLNSKIKQFSNKQKYEPAPKTHQATVTRVDSAGTVWVSIDGGAPETPCTTTSVAAKAGDRVMVTIQDHKAIVNGNTSRPATDDTNALEAVDRAAMQALQEIEAARQAALQAALQASKVATDFISMGEDGSTSLKAGNEELITYVPETDSVRIDKPLILGSTINCPWPVGAILHMATNTNPNNIYTGTTWTLIEGRFLLGSSASYGLGDEGGEDVHPLSINEIPWHGHDIGHNHSTPNHTHGTSIGGLLLTVGPSSGKEVTGLASGNNWRDAGIGRTRMINDGGGTTGWSSITFSGGAGGGAAHNNMPPYKVVNIWQRTA